MTNSLPILYYHGVGKHAKPRPWSFLTTPIDVFTAQIEWLVRHSYQFFTLTEAYAFARREQTLPEKSVVLTFDDGYLDNYVHAFPIAQKYGIKFTIYVNPEFVDSRPGLRPTLNEVWQGKKNAAELDWWGYAGWDELIAMQESGLVEIQSHAMSHTWYPTGSNIIDFHHPEDKYFWLFWNRFPEQKPYWLTQYRPEAVPFGLPVYENAKSLVARKYFPNPKMDDLLTAYVAQHGSAGFFTRPNWRQELMTLVNQNAAFNTGEYESESAQQERLRWELTESKRILEERLGKPVDFLAWPGGGVSDAQEKLAMAAGYKATTRKGQLYGPGCDYRRMTRGSAVFSNSLPAWLQTIFLSGQLDRLAGRNTPLAFLINSFRRQH